jgi:ABC-type sugar transport system ATPase subunit
MVPEDRRKQGLVMTMPVRANVTLPHLARFARRGLMRKGLETKAVRDLISYFRVRPATVEGDVSHFSGGNQQKVLIGKWLAGDPAVVILDEPSRGVDVGARQRIHEAIAELAAGGVAVLVISSEIEEVLGLSHRACLVDRGRIVEEVDPATTTEAEVLSALFRHQANPAPAFKDSARA